MTSGDEADEAPTKRRRLVKKESDGPETKESTAAAEELPGADGREEGPPGNTEADAGRFPPTAPEAMSPRQPGGALNYPPDPMMDQAGPQRPQRKAPRIISMELAAAFRRRRQWEQVRYKYEKVLEFQRQSLNHLLSFSNS